MGKGRFVVDEDAPVLVFDEASYGVKKGMPSKPRRKEETTKKGIASDPDE